MSTSSSRTWRAWASIKEQFAAKVDKLYKDIGKMCGDFRIKYACIVMTRQASQEYLYLYIVSLNVKRHMIRYIESLTTRY